MGAPQLHSPLRVGVEPGAWWILHGEITTIWDPERQVREVGQEFWSSAWKTSILSSKQWRKPREIFKQRYGITSLVFLKYCEEEIGMGRNSSGGTEWGSCCISNLGEYFPLLWMMVREQFHTCNGIAFKSFHPCRLRISQMFIGLL